MDSIMPNQAQEMYRIVEQVAWRYESEQLGGNFPDGRTWGTIPHELGQAARSVVRSVREASRSPKFNVKIR